MRNPLNQVRLNLEIIEHQLPACSRQSSRESDIGQDNLLEVLDSLYQHVAWCQIAVKRGTQVISMILDEVREKPISRNSFVHAHAAQVTRKAIDEYGFESAAERSKIIFNSKRDFMFRINETMYLFVLFNLIKNALYVLESRPEGTIFVTIEPGEGENLVKIRDTGPGISPAILPRLFDPYFTASKKGGTGLGLSYCKRVMRAFKGDITCSSEDGSYTEFVLHFPLVNQEEMRVTHEALVEENRPLLATKRILVVDDKERDRTAVCEMLRPHVAIADQAADGREAIARLSGAMYDLVLMNLSMPDPDGYATTGMIRNGVAGKEAVTVPIVGFSEQPYAATHVKAVKAGMVEVVTKPCLEEDLLRTMAGVFRELDGLSLHKLHGRKVLIADDSAVNRLGLAMLLEKYGMRTEGALNGREAIHKLETGSFDLALMDIGMPELNGLEATRRLRQSENPGVSLLPVIGVSGESDDDLVRDAIAAGMSDYVTKPVDMRLLVEKISHYF